MHEKLKALEWLTQAVISGMATADDSTTQLGRLESMRSIIFELRDRLPREPSSDDKPCDAKTMRAEQRRREDDPLIVRSDG